MFRKKKLSALKTLLLIVFAWFSHRADATHIRAADLYGKRISSSTYEFTLTIYTKTASNATGVAVLYPTSVFFSDGDTLNLDGSTNDPEVITVNEVQIRPQVYKNTIVFRHTFSGTGWKTVTYLDENRNADIKNIAGSSFVPFQIELGFLLFPSDVNNNTTPILSYDPIDDAAVGETYFHNPGAYDPDGDSISFSLSVPRGPGGELLNKVNSFDGLSSNETAYMDPNRVGSGPSVPTTFSLDPIRGDLVWDYPVEEGEYNIAFLVDEWRNGVRLSRTRRDMQIFVRDSENDRPILYIPKDTCVAATKELNSLIAAKDPDEIDVSLTNFGQVFEINNPASFTLINGLPDDTAAGVFQWTPDCNQVQTQPYQAQFRASDTYPLDVSLTTIETWLVYVNGPAPENLTASVNSSNNIALTWDSYDCTNASVISIYRAECDTSAINRTACTSGVPAAWGFMKIGEVDASQTFFLDNNGGNPFNTGIQYHYLIVTEFPLPKGGESYASNVASAELGSEIPVITQASVINTDTNNGTIELHLTAPTTIDGGAYPPPYTYEIFREEGFVEPTFPATPTYTYSQSTLKDTTYIDTNINTEDTNYTYSLKFYSDGNLVGTFGKSTSTWLQAQQNIGSITIGWSKKAPWFYVDSLYHVIWADTSGVLEIIDSVPGNQSNYTLSGLTAYDTVCFWVETKGVFCSQFLEGISINNTQELCTYALDSIPPCAPEVSLSILDCAFFDPNQPLENTLTWQLPVDCDSFDLAGFKIYARRVQESGFSLLATLQDPEARSFTHDNIDTRTYCYRVAAFDLSANESLNNEITCSDNCEYFELPNVFTPNNDDINETFVPFPVPRAVKSLDLQIYNRWGKLVYSASNTSTLEWDGRASDGSVLSSGTYYYVVEVIFDKLNPEDRLKEYKGWIQLVRE